MATTVFIKPAQSADIYKLKDELFVLSEESAARARVAACRNPGSTQC